MGKPRSSTISKLPVDKDSGGQGRELDLGKALDIVRKGGRSHRVEGDVEGPAEKKLSLRLKPDVVDRIREAAQARPVKTSSHSWIVEAILDKLKKESL